MEVRKANPKETADFLVGEYDKLAGPGGRFDFSRPPHEKWRQLAKIAARLADFVDAQFSDET